MKNLWEELEKYSASDYYPFHMPGHKRQLKDFYCYDITEIEGFDNLHHPQGLLQELQQKAARVYHAEESFFLINGSTGGILSAVSAVAKENKKLLIARNCHKSVYNAVFLNRLQAEYLWSGRIEEFELQGEITAEEIKKHVCGREDICGVVITSPTYDGILSDIRKIAEEVHTCGIPLIVDEAHGAHFALSDEVPESAVECGADIVINSLHKTLPALTQSALLHVQGKLVDREKLKNYLGIYQSSSPSYLLMASIDGCIDFIEKQGRSSYEKLCALRKKIDESAAELSYIKILPEGERRDIGKLIISVKGTEMSGWKLYQILLEQYHLQMEMAAQTYVLGILTCMDTEEGVKWLMDALKEIDGEIAENTVRTEIEGAISSTFEQDIYEAESASFKQSIYEIEPQPSGLSIYEAMQSEREWILPEEAIGRISGAFVCFYPPGIPFLVPGEIIGERQILAIEKEKAGKENLTGLSNDGKMCVLKNKASFRGESVVR